MVTTKKIKCEEKEYKIQRLLNRHFPFIVPKPLSWSKGVMTTEYTDGVNTCNESQVLKQVKEHLKTIKKKYPNFRHNNLTASNIILTKNGPMIIGFSKATFKGSDSTTCQKNKLLDFIKNSGVNVIRPCKK